MKLLVLDPNILSKPLHIANIIDSCDIIVLNTNEIIMSYLRIKYQFKVFTWKQRSVVINVCKHKVIQKNGVFVIDGNFILTLSRVKNIKSKNIKDGKIRQIVTLFNSNKEIYVNDKKFKVNHKNDIGYVGVDIDIDTKTYGNIGGTNVKVNGDKTRIIKSRLERKTKKKIKSNNI